MKPQHRIAPFRAAFLALLLIAPAYGASMNKSISVESGGQSNGESTVNGSISVGEGATVTGALKTVNGTIRIDQNAKVEDAATVNGGIRIASGVTADDLSSVNGQVKLGESVTVDGSISVVNGQISLDAGTIVASDVRNVNGEISLHGAQVGGDLTTVSGDVTLDDGSTLRGRLIVEKSSGWGWNRDKRKPKVIIGPGSKVLGGIELEREVELFISESAEVSGVSGEMDLDDAIIFSGDRP